MWTKLIVLLCALFLGWMTYRNVRANPQAFSSENIHKSLYTLGWLALFLIAFVAFLVLLVK
jgi:hypothetical protein